MIVQIFSPLRSAKDSFQQNKLGDTQKATFFEIRQRFNDVGSFTLHIPIGTRYADKIQENTLLFIDYKYWVIVKNIVSEISSDSFVHKITGTDLKGLLLDRITLYGKEQDTGTQGYDVVKGSTETVLKHYINNNMVNPTDTNRKITGLIIAQDRKRGLQNDTYMSRFETLSQLANKVCKNGKLGYYIGVNLTTNNLLFDVIKPTDRTVSQNETNRIVFSIDRRNIASITHEHGIEQSKNIIYATKSGGSLEADALTQLVSRSENVPKGIDRREIQLNVNTSSGKEISDMKTLALKQSEDYTQTSSFNCPITNIDNYDKIYFLGDYVTVKSEELNITVNTQITEVKTTIGENGEKNIDITFGEKKEKPINMLNKKINNKGV